MSVRHLVAAMALVALFILSASAEEGVLSRLNPFADHQSSSSAQNKTFPGFSNHKSKKKPEKTIIGKTVDSVSSTTKTAWNKTTSLLSPKNLLPGSSAKPATTAKRKTSHPGKFASHEEDAEPKTVSSWLKQPRIKP